MNLNYPDFLNSNNEDDKLKLPPNSNGAFNDSLFNKLSNLDANASTSPTSQGFDLSSGSQPSSNANVPGASRSGSIDNNNNNNNQLPITSPLVNAFSPPFGPFFNNPHDSFTLPSELQGGIGNISSRRPSYAAESFTRSPGPGPGLFPQHQPPYQPPHPQQQQQQQQQQAHHPSLLHQPPQQMPPSFIPSNNLHPQMQQPKNLMQYAAVNNYSHYFDIDHLNDSFGNINLNSNLNEFQNRRPSQLIDFGSSMPGMPGGPKSNLGGAPGPIPGGAGGAGGAGAGGISNVGTGPNKTTNTNPNTKSSTANNIKLENGLYLNNQYIVASSDLRALFAKTAKYFQNVELTQSILSELNSFLVNPVMLKLIQFIKNLNNLTFNHKTLCLVINKNGKFDLLSYPNNSNIYLQKNDLVIVDGDRGKDLVMIAEPLIDLNLAILFNFLKKLEHLKSLTIVDGNAINAASNNTNNSNNNNNNNNKFGGTHSPQLNASSIINNHSNEDNEFIITLPTKQVLRFATPKEIHKISGKFLEEKKAFITCHNKIKELDLQNNLQLINVEYQLDFKKLIFYYFANFKRVDFRGLIKELFKIYKTRIWLCAVLPYDKPELMTFNTTMPPLDNVIPKEYELSNEQILDFSINEFNNLSTPNYFHLKNLFNLINGLKHDLGGYFYGFNDSFDDNTSQKRKGLVPNSDTNITPSSNLSNPSPNDPKLTAKITPDFNPFGDL